MATRLPAAVILVSLVSLLVATIVGVTTGRSLGDELNEDRLVSLRSSGAFDIAAQMTSLSRTAEALAASPQAVIAIESFREAHAELLTLPFSDLVEEAESIVVDYRSTYVEPLRAVGRDLDIRDIVPDNTAGIYIQHQYAVDLGVITEPASIDNPRDGSRWTEVHEIVHPIYRDVVSRLDLFDLYLVEADDAFVVYSVNKRPDIATSLDVGPFSGSFLASAVDQVRDDPMAGTVISDLSFYDPALLAPVGVIASPVLDEGRLVGVMVLMYDSARFNDTLTAGGDWDSGGFPPTGESYLIGADGVTRSDPRSFLEDPAAHLVASVEAGVLGAADSSFIDVAGTTVLSQPVISEAVDAGIDGDRSVQERQTMVGGRALSTVEAVELEGVRWFVVTELSVAEANGNLDDFTEILIVGTAIFIITLAFLAVAWASRIVRPVRAISDRLGSGGDELGPVSVPARSPVEFRRLAESFESMSDALHDQRAKLADARKDRLRLLRRMLPSVIADRIAAGDLKSLERIPQATVVVIVVQGLSALVHIDGGADGSGRELVERLHGELDALAERHGVERVKVVGDAYFAACGHARPYIDHAPRVLSFAADARDAIREIGAAVPDGLDVSVGIHTGSVTVGVSADRRLMYDVWGEPVNAAHHLARLAAQGEILVSNEAAVLLPETVEMSRPVGRSDDSIWSVSTISMRGPV